MSGARQRGATTTQLKALESAEAGYANTSDAQSTVTTPFLRRRKATRRVSWVPLLKAKLRRLQFKVQRHPQVWSRFMTVSMGILLIVLGIVRHNASSSSSSSFHGIHTPNPMSVTRHLKSSKYAQALLRRLPMTKERTGNNDHHQHNNFRVVPNFNFEITISSIPATIHHKFHYPSNQHFKKILGKVPDRGGLALVFFEDQDGRRYIVRDDARNVNDYRDPNLPADDDMTDSYYYFDDDYLRGLKLNTMEDHVTNTAMIPNNNNNKNTAIHNNQTNKKKKQCRRIAEHTMNLQNCNELHQLDRLDPNFFFMFLNEGTYRQVFSIIYRGRELFAIKDLSHDLEYQHDNYEFVRMDAIVAERLSASPRTFDIYGFCGVAILSEYFYHGDIEEDLMGGEEGFMDPKKLNDRESLQPQNNLTGIEKLVLSLEMAEALADLHGYANGLIVHDDVQLSQFLFNKDKTRLKLNDFNRAEFPLFDENNQEYCPWKNGPGFGNWRSPEEYQDWPLTEQIDVWSLGNNMYTILTGLQPLYDEPDSTIAIKRMIQGETAFIDPRYRLRSKSEAVLAEVIQKCFAYQPENRPSIFEIVRILQSAVDENLSPGLTRATVLKCVKTLF